MLFEVAKKYAEDVLSGAEITTKEVKIQCSWFLRDLEQQLDDNYPYYFDNDEIVKIEGILALLKFVTGIGVIGENILDKIAPFQCFFLANVFGWRFKADPFRYKHRDITLFIPRKNAKTFICSICIILLMLLEDEYSEFYSICLDRELAGEVRKAIVQIIEGSPAIAKYFTIPKTLQSKIVCKLTKSFYQARTSEASRNNAIRPSGFI
jgi:phage terminase large subunit-like protein